MREREELQAELLDRYWLALERDDAASPPEELDPEIAATARRLVRAARPPRPGATFAARLRERLAAEAATVDRRNGRATGAVQRPRPSHGPRWWPLAGLATAALVVVVVGLALWMARAQTVSAREILDKAQATATNVAAGGVQSFVLTEVTRSRPANPRLNAEAGFTGQERIHVETSHWYEAPDRWRIERKGTVLGPDGQELPDKAWRWITVSDGADVWTYDALHNTVQVNPWSPNADGKGGLSPFGQDATDLATVIERARACGTPTLRGTETVAGRPAYVVDLGSSTCPSASAPEINGPSVIWVDQETFFVLKRVQYSGVDGQLLSTTEVTRIEYNVPIDPERFAFTPPAGARVEDFRPKPAPSADQLRQQVGQLARQVDFPIFVPRVVPNGLAPLQPRLDDVGGPQVQIGYVPPDEAGKTAVAGPTGVTITQRKATYAWVQRWTEQAEPVAISGEQGWLRRGTSGITGSGTGSDSAVVVLRDGTLVSVASFAVPPETLVEIAASLEPAPGSHPPLPNPTPPTLAEV
ncbi:MAG TPA: hypothetical protein VIN09_12160, partial [Chloroflexota bacterium]